MSITQQRPYRSYLLRLWQVYDEGKQHWQASLESAQTGERIPFANLVDLVEYLLQQIQADDQLYEKEVLNRLFRDW